VSKKEVWMYNHQNGLWEEAGQDNLAGYMATHFAPVRDEYINALHCDPDESDRFFPVASGEEEKKLRQKQRKSAVVGIRSSENTRKKNAYKQEFFTHTDVQDPLFPSKLNDNPDVMSFHNGVLNLRDGTFRKRRFDDYLSKCLDIDYDRDAPTNPVWEAFIRDIFDADGLVAEEIAEFMQVWIGYGITGHNNAQQCAIMFGNGSNGKSLFNDVLIATLKCSAGKMVDTWSSTMFDDASTKKESSNQATPELAKLVGCNIGLINETAEGLLFAEAFKKLVDNSQSLSYRQMYQTSKSLKLITKFTFSTNHFPMFPTEVAYERRINVVPMLVTFVEEPTKPNQKRKDTQLFDKMTATVQARQGIINWMVAGARKYYDRGLRVLPPPQCCEKYKKQYVAQNDWTAFFEYTGEKTDWMTKADIWEEINTRLERRDITKAKMVTKLVEMGAKKGQKRLNGVGQIVFYGIKTKADYADLDDVPATGWFS
jgi:P4 family phage/plasmid primase-like protien